jgi:hypothetical protein
MYNRDTLLKDLKENVCEIFFTKVNGEKRAMRCSLREDLLPASYLQTEEAKVSDFHKTNPDVLAVWDLQNNGWRSFRIDSVEYVQVVDTY